MAASYPGSIKSFTTKTDSSDVIRASHINDLQDEVVAVETQLGITSSPASGSVRERLDNLEAADLQLDIKNSCQLGTTANITLSGEQSIDGTTTSSSRVLVKDQSTASQNGIYVSNSSTWVRATDFDANAEVTAGAFTWVTEGTANRNTGWVLNTGSASITVGSTSLTFAQYSAAFPYDWTASDGSTTSLVSDGDTFTFTGGTGIDSTVSGDAVTHAIDSTVATLAGSQTLTNKTMTSPVLNTGVSGSAILDSDSMSGASATTLSSSESIKAYVDAQVTASDLDFQGDSGGALSIDLDSETLDIEGGTGIDTSGSSNTLTVAIDSTVTTLTGSQTLTNKTLTSPVLNTGVSGTAVKDEDNMSSDSATHLATQQSIKAYVDAQIATEDTIAELNDTDVSSEASGNILVHDGSNSWDNKAVSGDATLASTGAITIAADAVTYAKIQNVTATDRLLGRDSAGAGIVEEITPANVRTMINVEDGADVTDATNVTAAGALMDSELAGLAAVKATTGTFLTADETKLDGIEASADVTDTANVTAAGALMDSEVDADIKTLSLPASTTISAFGATLVDDAAASNARTTLGLGALATLDSVAAGQIDANSVDSSELVDGSIDESHLSATNSATDNYLLSYDDGTSGFTWVAPAAADAYTVSVSNNDSTPGYLNGKLVAGTNITLTEGSDGGNETLTVAASGASEGDAIAFAIALGG